MKSFKAFMLLSESRSRDEEFAEIVKAVSKSNQNIPMSELKNFDSALKDYAYNVNGTTSRTATLVIRAPSSDRNRVKSNVERQLKGAGFSVKSLRKGGSTGTTQVNINGYNLDITYKPISGGMSETTLNSTITELVPALAFMANRTNFSSVDDLYAFVSELKGNEQGVYVDRRDMKAGHEFIESMPSSSKFEEKMQNAIGVIVYLRDLNMKSKIKKVYWGYRKKPAGIAPNHKGDLFVEFEGGEMLGVSLKAGGAKTKEPQLNTYVNKMFDHFGYSGMKAELEEAVYQKIHSQLGLPKDWRSRSNKSDAIDTIEQFREAEPGKYESMYDEMLEMVRSAVISAVNRDRDNTIDYIKKQVLQKDDSVPLVVIKAIGTRYEQVTDEDKLDTILPMVSKITAYASDRSKQNWFIDLSTKDGTTTTMNMSVRSNSPKPNNKIAQGFNLAIKFNGIK